MSNRVNPPIAALASLNLPRPLLDVLNQLWLRSGGGEDTVSVTDSNSTTIASRLTAQINNTLDEVDSLRAELNVVRSLLRQSVSENENTINELESRTKRLTAALNAAQDRIDELEGMI